MRILIVDDDFVSRRMLYKIVSGYGECHLAGNGAEAVDLFQAAFEDSRPYDAVFLDMLMPEMNGMETLKNIRKFEQENGIKGLDGTKIIMITVVENSKDIMASFNEGCEGYIIKPFDKEKIIGKLKEMFGEI